MASFVFKLCNRNNYSNFPGISQLEFDFGE